MAEKAADNKLVEVEDYYDKIHLKTWPRRTASVMTGATLGLIYGAIIGSIASFLPYAIAKVGISGVSTAAAVLPSLATVGGYAALFGISIALIGTAIAADVGANAGAISAGLEEKEKREKLEKLAEYSLAQTKVTTNTPASTERPVQQNPDNNTKRPLFSWKIAMFTAPLFTFFGALLALHPTGTSILSGLGFGELSGAAATTVLAAVFGMFGTVIAAKNSLFSNKINNFYTKLITDEYFYKEPQKETVVQPQPAMHQTDDKTPAQECRCKGKSFAADTPRFSLQNLIEKTEDRGIAQDNVVIR